MQEYTVIQFGVVVTYKPYRAFSMFAVFMEYPDGMIKTLYDGNDQNEACEIYTERCK